MGGLAAMSCGGGYPKPAEGVDVVAVDLDGVLAEGTWPSPAIGVLIPAGAQIVKHYHDEGYEVVVFTSRPGSHRNRIWDFLEENGLDEYVYDVKTGKLLAGLYVDDRAYNPVAR